MATRLTKLVHRVHRLFGSVFALLLVVWFASGAVMTFADFPSYSEAERLASAPPFPAGTRVVLAPELALLLETHVLPRGLRARLSMLEGAATWVAPDARGLRRAYRDRAQVEPLDATRVSAEIARRSPKRVRSIERVDEPDQWSVGLARPGVLPFYRVYLDDDEGEQLYLSARTGEVVLNSTRGERALAWVGAIPHWIYPTLLRQHRELWRDTVLVLSALGLMVSLSGSLAGVWLWSTRRRKQIHRPVRDPWLRWHQRLGLGFGLLVSTWLFSGALTLTPFDWTGDEGPSRSEQHTLYGAASGAASWPLSDALAHCQRELEVRELELTSFAGKTYAVCYDGRAQTRLIDLSDPLLQPRPTLAHTAFAELAHALGDAELSEQHTFDAYYYPKHADPSARVPYYRLQRTSADQVSFYLDPRRARVALRYTRAGRLDRWLRHGLHSLELPGLYEHRVLWRTLVIFAMVLGTLLSGLGLLMSVRKILRRLRRVRRV